MGLNLSRFPFKQKQTKKKKPEKSNCCKTSVEKLNLTAFCHKFLGFPSCSRFLSNRNQSGFDLQSHLLKVINGELSLTLTAQSKQQEHILAELPIVGTDEQHIATKKLFTAQ